MKELLNKITPNWHKILIMRYEKYAPTHLYWERRVDINKLIKLMILDDKNIENILKKCADTSVYNPKVKLAEAEKRIMAPKQGVKVKA